MKTRTTNSFLDEIQGFERPAWWKRIISPPLAVLILVIVFVVYGLYKLQVRPLLTMRLPDHQAAPLDTPPVELTSFQVRIDGEAALPTLVATKGDSLYVAFRNLSVIQLYSSRLQLLKTLRLDKPFRVEPTALEVTDSLIIVADSAAQQICFYDREGDFLTFISWYPDQRTRIMPLDLTATKDQLAVIDSRAHRLDVISLRNNPPFSEFLELLDAIPFWSRSATQYPYFALVSPDQNYWIGQSDNISILRPDGTKLGNVEPSPRTRLVRPTDATFIDLHGITRGADADSATSWSDIRVQVVDKGAGKVFSYDLGGRLRLVYPRDRELRLPVSIATMPNTRTIFVTETENAEITVFGY